MASLTQNQSVLSWIEEKADLVKPDKIVWIDGSEEQIEALRAEACSTGELIKLNEELLPDCYYHRTAVNDGAPISAALQRFGLLDAEDVDVVSVGERTGSLVTAFGELGAAHSESLKRRIRIATAALGGFALGFAFLLVFTFATGIVLSILGLSQSIIAK